MSFQEHTRRYRSRLERALTVLDSPALAALAGELEALRERRGRLFVLGNGGSATTASHLANDLGAGLGERGLDTIALADSMPGMTAAANDRGYDDVFAHQLRPRLRAGDLVLSLSASGSSENLVRATTLAQEVGARTAAIVGMDGGRLHELADVAVHIPTDAGDYGPAEDLQLVLDHVLADWLRDLG
ncbi:MAG: SIS domain-containing protein [Proteobacteria bacterium]|nr:SIS domain-containing protein [Pseudomonadota bacterium]